MTVTGRWVKVPRLGFRHTSTAPRLTVWHTKLSAGSKMLAWYFIWYFFGISLLSAPCFDTVGWASGRASGLSKTEWWGAGVVICLEWGATCIWSSWCHCHWLSVASVKIQIGFTFLIPVHLGSPGQKDVKQVCACVVWYFNVMFCITLSIHCIVDDACRMLFIVLDCRNFGRSIVSTMILLMSMTGTVVYGQVHTIRLQAPWQRTSLAHSLLPRSHQTNDCCRGIVALRWMLVNFYYWH